MNCFTVLDGMQLYKKGCVYVCVCVCVLPILVPSPGKNLRTLLNSGNSSIASELAGRAW